MASSIHHWRCWNPKVPILILLLLRQSCKGFPVLYRRALTTVADYFKGMVWKLLNLPFHRTGEEGKKSVLPWPSLCFGIFLHQLSNLLTIIADYSLRNKKVLALADQEGAVKSSFFFFWSKQRSWKQQMDYHLSFFKLSHKTNYGLHRIGCSTPARSSAVSENHGWSNEKHWPLWQRIWLRTKI